MLAAAAGQTLHQRSGKAVTVHRGPAKNLHYCSGSARGKKISSYLKKPNTRTLWGGSLLLESKENVSTTTAGIKANIPTWKKTVFHHIMYLETFNTHQIQQPQLVASEKLYSTLHYFCNGQKCLTFQFKHQASEVLKITLNGGTLPKSLASRPFF